MVGSIPMKYLYRHAFLAVTSAYLVSWLWVLDSKASGTLTVPLADSITIAQMGEWDEWRRQKDSEDVFERMRRDSEKRRIERDEEKRSQGFKQAEEVVVMIAAEGATPTLGAGIIFAADKDSLYIATANHVVRRGAMETRDLQVKLRAFSDTPFEATLLPHADAELDLAVLSVTALGKHRVVGCAFPRDLLTDASALKRGDAVFPLVLLCYKL
jgi:S1-C subfamily serine protease